MTDGTIDTAWLNKLDTWLANQTAPKGVVTIVCQTEIQKMAEHSEQLGYFQPNQSQQSKCCLCSPITDHETWSPRPGNCVSVLRMSSARYEKPVPMTLFSIYRWWPSCGVQFSVSSALLTSTEPVDGTVPKLLTRDPTSRGGLWPSDPIQPGHWFSECSTTRLGWSLGHRILCCCTLDY